MSSMPRSLMERLENLKADDRLRLLQRGRGQDFSSNDYLGFASDVELRNRWIRTLHEFSTGSTGSRLLRGEMDIHQRAELKLAQWIGRRSALLFHSGYQANVGLMSSLLQEGDVVFSDELNHASIIDGIRLGRGKKIIYPNKDVKFLERQLQQEKSTGLKIIVTESVFSMDGDIAPLKELVNLALQYEAHLVVDEAHATGIFGKRGGGLVQHLGLEKDVLATVHTGGKSLGAAGGWVTCSEELKKYLINFSRAFIYSTAPIPALSSLLITSVEYWNEVGSQRAQSLLEKCRVFREMLSTLKCDTNVQGPIFPIIIGDNGRALLVANRLQENGYDVRAIRPPTVPQGTSRLRITLHHHNSEADIDGLFGILKESL